MLTPPAADGGSLQISELRKDRTISVFTSPTPLRVGAADVSILVKHADAGDSAADSKFVVRAWPLSKRQNVISAPSHSRSGHEQADAGGPTHVQRSGLVAYRSDRAGGRRQTSTRLRRRSLESVSARGWSFRPGSCGRSCQSDFIWLIDCARANVVTRWVAEKRAALSHRFPLDRLAIASLAEAGLIAAGEKRSRPPDRSP